MSHRLSKKRLRDAAIIADLRGRDEAFFAELKVPRAALEQAQLDLVGRMVFPGDPRYDTDRKLFNPLFDAFPSLIIYCLTEADVRIALNLGWGHHLPVTIRSGGHSTAGYSASAGMLIDVSGLNDVLIWPDNPIATVGCGTTFGKLNSALAMRQLHMPVGECDDVCVGGFMQGGGYGFTSRTFGIHSDNVLGIRVMLADGSVVNASAKSNRDLWWAMRGGTGNNFGVLLSANYQLRPLGKVYGWAIYWPLAEESDRQTAAAALMQMQADFFRTAPPEFNIQVSICYQPTEPGGAELVPQLLVRGLYVGSQADGRAAIQPLIDMAGAVFQYDAFDSFNTIDAMLLNSPYDIPPLPPARGMPNEDKQARYVKRDLTLAEWQSMLDFFVTSPNQWSYLYLEIYGGAINAYPLEDSAFIHRDVAFDACLDVFWYPEDDPTPPENFLTDWCTLMQPMWNGHVYQNYPSGAVPDYRANYWGSALDALVAVKNKYDPRGFFAFPQMVAPYPDGAGKTGTAATGASVTWPPEVARALAQPIILADGGKNP